MGRALDFVVLIIAIFGIFTVQVVAGAMLDPLRGEIQEDYELTNEETANMDSMLLILVREYRRQKNSAVRRV